MYVEKFFLPLEVVRTEVLVVSYGLAEARGDTFSDDVDEMVVCHLRIDIVSIDVIQVFLHGTCELEITDLV